MYAKLFLGLIFLAVSAPQLAYGNSSVSFSEDVIPILDQDPAITRPALARVRVEEMGKGVRISGSICPGLAGTRVSPYRFAAKRDGEALQLVVNTHVEFFNSAGQIVFRIVDGVPEDDDSRLEEAVAYEEVFSSLRLTHPEEE